MNKTLIKMLLNFMHILERNTTLTLYIGALAKTSIKKKCSTTDLVSSPTQTLPSHEEKGDYLAWLCQVSNLDF